MKATLKNYHQSPRKVRLVADMIRGKSVPAARAALHFLPKKSSPAISKLLESAVANSGATPDALFVKSIAVNKGAVMRRARPFSRGRSGSIRKTMSIVTLELGTNAPAKAKKTRAKKTKVTKEN
jgi:large subunit ribosomal protein L22